MGLATGVAASIALITMPAAAQTMAPNVAIVSPTATDWIPADRGDTDAARGGNIYAVMLGAAGVFIKVCGGAKVDACARRTVTAFTTTKAAQVWACHRYRRFC